MIVSVDVLLQQGDLLGAASEGGSWKGVPGVGVGMVAVRGSER